MASPAAPRTRAAAARLLRPPALPGRCRRGLGEWRAAAPRRGGAWQRPAGGSLEVPRVCIPAAAVASAAAFAGAAGVRRARSVRRALANAVAEQDAWLSTADDLPDEVDGYKVTPVCVTPKPQIPRSGRKEICALVVSDEQEEIEDTVFWQPPAGTAAQQAISALDDAFGVLGVWPAAWVAAERVIALCASRRRGPSAAPLRILEIGCGSGLPSLCALASGNSVLATDLEELPLRLLEAAARSQCLEGELETQTVDVLAAGSPQTTGGLVRSSGNPCPSDSERFDAIVCSDCLYKLDVAEAIARLIARALLRWPTTTIIVTDANRRGRQAFLDTLAMSLGLGLGESSPPVFKDTQVPPWAADDARDPFDGTSTCEVGLLSLYQ